MGESCSSSRARERSRTPPTRVSRSGCSTARAPHALVLCHRAGDTEVEGYPGQPLLPLPELVDLYTRVGLPARRPVVACIALNTAHLDDDAARAAIAAAERADGAAGRRPCSLRRRASCSTQSLNRPLRFSTSAPDGGGHDPT